MFRLATMLLCALITFAVSAAPAPVYKPDPIRLFGLTGWDKPIDPLGASQVDRHGDKLVVTLATTKDIQADAYYKDWDRVMLLRDVEGDFQMQVRASGNFMPTAKNEFSEGGIILKGGECWCLVTRVGRRIDGDLEDMVRGNFCAGDEVLGLCPPAFDRSEKFVYPTVYFRLERQGAKLRMQYSHDGKKWIPSEKEVPRLPRKVKIGVLGAAKSKVPFKVVFDQFKLTQASK